MKTKKIVRRTKIERLKDQIDEKVAELAGIANGAVLQLTKERMNNCVAESKAKLSFLNSVTANRKKRATQNKRRIAEFNNKF